VTGMDHSLRDVTVPDLIDTLRDAEDHLDVVQPGALREPLSLWFLATLEQAKRERWTQLMGKPVVAVWNAARAVLDQTDEVQGQVDVGG